MAAVAGAATAADEAIEVNAGVLARRLDALCEDGWETWQRFDRAVRQDHFHPFVPANYDVARTLLAELYAPGRRFLEWGSATGIITIIADMLGYDASGIEIDPSLVAIARDTARRHDSAARFVVGSFLPAGYSYRPRDGDGRTGTIENGRSGYLELGAALEDFDIVFGYPWGGEESVMIDVMQQYGRADALLLLYDSDDTVRMYRGGTLVTRWRPAAAPG